MTLVIMAAGMGSRFGGLKQIEPIGPSGEFILDYSIYDAIRAGFNKVVFIIKEENYELFRNTVGKRIENKVEVKYVFQSFNTVPGNYIIPETRIKPLGTAHAILSCKDVVNENFVVLNADDFYGQNAYKVAKEFFNEIKDNDKEHFCMVSYIIKNTIINDSEVARGICQIKDNYLTDIVESKIKKVNNKYLATPIDYDNYTSIPENTVVSMNIWGFTPKIFDYLNIKFLEFLENNKNYLDKKEFLIPNCVESAIKENFADVKVLEISSKWLGVTYKEDKDILVNEINKMINIGEYPNNLWR